MRRRSGFDRMMDFTSSAPPKTAAASDCSGCEGAGNAEVEKAVQGHSLTLQHGAQAHRHSTTTVQSPAAAQVE